MHRDPTRQVQEGADTATAEMVTRYHDNYHAHPPLTFGPNVPFNILTTPQGNTGYATVKQPDCVASQRATPAIDNNVRPDSARHTVGRTAHTPKRNSPDRQCAEPSSRKLQRARQGCLSTFQGTAPSGQRSRSCRTERTAAQVRNQLSNLKIALSATLLSYGDHVKVFNRRKKLQRPPLRKHSGIITKNLNLF